MPRPVVPILCSPRAASRARSMAPCSGRIRAAFSAMRRMSGADGQALAADPLDLGEQRVRVDHHAVADDAELAAHQAGGEQARACRSGCRRRGCGRRYARPGSARRSRRGWRASPRPCPCPRRPTGRRSPRRWPLLGFRCVEQGHSTSSRLGSRGRFRFGRSGCKIWGLWRRTRKCLAIGTRYLSSATKRS